ncbi:MAG: enoyl-CoA hydratase/isomerase family protein [Chloroflexi bacterium]|nr:enoyl-CoA hydratase/isomerase family protein [Chloroflexota bacterium]
MFVEDILYEKKDGIAVITLNRPHRMNALPLHYWSDVLPQYWADFEKDKSVRVGIVTAAGDRAFCTGVDVKDTAERNQKSGGAPQASKPILATPWQNKVSKPVICAVNGLVGGGGLMFVSDCDISIAASTAQFFNPGVAVGIVALVGQAAWTKWVPFHSVMRMALMGPGERLSAQRAYELGIVTEVVSDKPLVDRAKEIATIMSNNSPAALRVAKKALWAALEEGSLRGAHDAVMRVTRELSGHPDQIEGPRAFAEKRKPKWKEPE